MCTRAIISLTLCFVPVAVVCAADAGQKEREKLQGTWTVEGGEVNGSPLSPREKKASWVFEKDRLTWVAGTTKQRLTFRLDPNKIPKAIDIHSDGAQFQGIYRLEGDTLRVAYGKERPTAFKAPRGSKHVLVVLKRHKGKK
jgi:uncharacterized protein (TIGR03067 family)